MLTITSREDYLSLFFFFEKEDYLSLWSTNFVAIVSIYTKVYSYHILAKNIIFSILDKFFFVLKISKWTKMKGRIPCMHMRITSLNPRKIYMVVNIKYP